MSLQLLFSRERTLTSKVVAAATLSWCSHVDFILPDDTLVGAIPGEGVKIQVVPDYDGLFARWEIWEIDAPTSALDYALSQVGKPYDWSGVFAFLFPNRVWQDESKWFCSELVFAALAYSGVSLLNGDPHRITPGNLLLSPLLKPHTKVQS